MTRILSDILQNHEPHFRLQLRQLEQISGHQNTDIKLSVQVHQDTKDKIARLGLDQHDTSTSELYHVLQSRLSSDDERLERSLRTRAATHISAEADVMEGMLHALQSDARSISTFAIKLTALKRTIKKTPPKRLQKQLGYRSLDAMIRNEPVAALIAAAEVVESNAWRRSWLDSYKKLKTNDFESRPATILCPNAKRWEAITQQMITARAHTVLALPEVGTVILMPLPSERPRGMVVASVALALQELNTIRSASSYLRASQLQGDFAVRVRAVADGSVNLSTPSMQQAFSWQLVQQYFARTKATINEDVFGPYAEVNDFQWSSVERRLAELCPSMEFWQGTSFLSFIHEGQTVSLNVIDAAINNCNQLAYELRTSMHAQQALWHELTLRYLDRESLESAVSNLLQPKLAKEMALN